MSILVVAAWLPELEGLPDSVRRRAIGVGLVEAAAGIERALAEERPSAIYLVGTAGVLPPAPLKIGQVVVARTALLAMRPGEGAPAPMGVGASADLALAEHAAKRLRAALVDVASPLGITSDDAEAVRLGKSAHVEQLECFAVLSAAARAQVPATAVFAIANTVGSRAREEWQLHRERAEAAAREELIRVLS